MAGIHKEYYHNVIMQNFYPAGDWLSKLTNMDAHVDNNTINLASIGADPQVFINNFSWPLMAGAASANAHAIQLATFDTTPTHLANVEEMETNFDYAVAITSQHTKTLYKQAALHAAYNLAPSYDNTDTPIVTTGTFSFGDIIDMSAKFDTAELPSDDRVLLLNPAHLADLRKEDYKLYKDLLQAKEYHGFDIAITTATPNYMPDGMGGYTKVPIGTMYGNQKSSIAFCASENMRAMGSITGEPELRWADYRGWLIGFQMRFVAMNIRGKGIGAIVSQ